MANILNVQGTENRNTLEYIGIWEKVNNPHFNYGEFATIRNNAGLNNFKISVKEFVERTGAICLQAKAGRYGGTYAHKDIAFEFATWISQPSGYFQDRSTGIFDGLNRWSIRLSP